jgi:N,N'-diacetylchitobiose transport system permease protein
VKPVRRRPRRLTGIRSTQTREEAMMPTATAPPRARSVRRDPLARTARERARRRTDAGAAITLLAPSLVILGVMVGYPAVLMLVQSFTDYSIRNKVQGTFPEIVGFENYLEVFTQSDFPAVLLRSLGLMIVMTVLIVGLGALVAVLMTRLTKGWRLLVSIGLLLAWAMPPLAATTVWGWIFDTQYGVVNWAMNTITGTSDFTNHSWLLNPWSFFLVLTIIVVWQGVPFAAFTLFAALGQVPGEVLEAASLDGATGWQRFRLVVFPYLRNVVTVVVVLQVIWNLRVFTQVYTLQQRGGVISETNVLGTYIFRQGVGEFGVTSAIGVLMVILLLSLSWGYVRTTLKEEEL